MKNSNNQQWLPGWLILLGILTAIAPLSIDMYLPSFPLIEKDLAGWPGSVELTLGSFFVGLTIGQLFYGPLSDRFGRKPPLYIGFAMYAIASLGAALSPNIPTLIFWRFLQGLGGCTGIILPSAIVRDRTTAQEGARAFSILMLVMGVAPILAPLAGGWVLTHFSWQGIFYLLTIFSVACLIAMKFGLEESHHTEHEPPLRLISVLKNYGYLLTNKPFLGFALGGGLAMAGMFSYIAGSPFVLINLYGVAPQDYGWYFGSNAFALIASSQLNAHLLKQYAATSILRTALFVPAVVSLIFLGVTLMGYANLYWTVGSFFLFVGSLGFIIPNAMASGLATHGQQAGTAAALMGALQFLFATLVGSLVGLLHNNTGEPLALMMALCGTSAWLSHRHLVKTHHA